MVSTRYLLDLYLSEVLVWFHLACSPCSWQIYPLGLMIYIYIYIYWLFTKPGILVRNLEETDRKLGESRELRKICEQRIFSEISHVKNEKNSSII